MVFVALETYINLESHTNTSVTKIYKKREDAVKKIEEFLTEMIENEESSDSESDSESSGSESSSESSSESDSDESDSPLIEHDTQCKRIKALANTVWKGEPRDIIGDICDPEENFYVEIEFDSGFYSVSLETIGIE